MSDNKYIIDKDSLTGIADAVRNKLGNGTAITDEDAGYYPAPVKKLGFSEKARTVGYSGPGSGYEPNTIYARPILELKNICGIRPSYIKVTVTDSTGFNNNDIIFRYTNVDAPAFSRVASANFANYIAILPIPDDIDDCYIAYGAYYSSYSSQYSHRSTPPYDVVFLDSNQNEIYINEYSGDSFAVDKWGTTKTFLTGTSFEKIPLTIDDIRNKIVNHLFASGGGGGGGTAERWLVKKFDDGRGPYTLPTDLDTFEKFSTRIRAIQLNGPRGEVLFKTDGTLCSYKDLNMAAPRVVNNMISASISEQDIIDAYNDDRLFVIIADDNRY